jgi:hypothetical protein
MYLMLFALAVAIGILVAARLRAGPVKWLEAWKNIGKAFGRLVRNGRELLLFALFEIVAVNLAALIFLTFGIKAGAFVLVGAVCLFALWALPPAAKR